MNRYVICILACLTLGLAPFLPEPHLVEKVRWVANGAEGMRHIDWFDLVLHGSPWIVLLGLLVYDAIRGILRRG
jgi:hypothetical protein